MAEVGKIGDSVTKILDQECLKDLADKIINEDVEEVIVIYHDKADNCLTYGTNIKEWAKVFGSMDMAGELMHEDWIAQRQEDDESGE